MCLSCWYDSVSVCQPVFGPVFTSLSFFSLPREEYRQLVSNMDEILAVQQHLLAALEDCATKLSTEQRVGRVFLANAPRMKQVHQTYCAAHPKAVCVIDKYKYVYRSIFSIQVYLVYCFF